MNIRVVIVTTVHLNGIFALVTEFSKALEKCHVLIDIVSSCFVISRSGRGRSSEFPSPRYVHVIIFSLTAVPDAAPCGLPTVEVINIDTDFFFRITPSQHPIPEVRAWPMRATA